MSQWVLYIAPVSETRACTHTIFLCLVRCSEETVIIWIYGKPVFVIETKFVFERAQSFGL